MCDRTVHAPAVREPEKLAQRHSACSFGEAARAVSPERPCRARSFCLIVCGALPLRRRHHRMHCGRSLPRTAFGRGESYRGRCKCARGPSAILPPGGVAVRHQDSILEYRAGFYLKLALGACVVSGALFAWQVPAGLQGYGGSWLGYTLGTIAALLILWLLALGVRKRNYRSRLGTVQGWTSAHVYLGASLLVIATLHTGFEFGWNV